ncbi:PREDICTED: adenylate kinase isoenzyme 5-like [Nicrophorus vespilloides]|uniref:Adenylate kinase isoenzyme 5-like n=1 Tax=Nicrophorus vespilloides TaxID=110193 RepID=A0ABM1N8F6_NICVS|nr:PREDICTED: adenylate kinase isoenzyme 5-like [Nicrophorus vespilloides]
MGRGFGFCWCCYKPKVKDRFDLQPFLMRRLPIFWIMGPPGCGKSTLACMLEKSSKYNLVKISDLINEEITKGKFRAKIIEDCLKKGKFVPDEIIVTLIKEYIFLNYANAKGFIFSGFPIHLRQAKLFELEICKVNIIIYCTLVLDSLLGRMITKYGEINTEQVRLQFVEKHKSSQSIYKYYEHKTLKVMTNYPPEETVTKLISDLEDYWGYKFERLYNKN